MVRAIWRCHSTAPMPTTRTPRSKNCRTEASHGVEIWGIQPEVIHHSGLVAFTEADRTLEEGEHLRMFILKRHPEDFTDIPRCQPDQMDPI